MSMLYAYLNPNLTNAQLAELAEHDIQCKKRVFAQFKECHDALKTDEEKQRYINACLPVITQFWMF